MSGFNVFFFAGSIGDYSDFPTFETDHNFDEKKNHYLNSLFFLRLCFIMAAESEHPPSTQVLNPSIRSYVAVFLFNYELDNQHPFSSVSLDNFEGTDFPFNLINGHMGLADRLKARTLSRLPGSKYCIFAKCEEGIYI